MSSALRAHYARLGLHLRGNAVFSREELAAAYRAAALRTHPDRGGCRHAFAQLTASYEAALAASAGTRVYDPSSLRSHGRAAADGRAGSRGEENARLIATLVVPVATLAAVSVRLVYKSGDEQHLRAGGSSRVPARMAQVHDRARNGRLRGVDAMPESGHHAEQAESR